MGPPLDKNSKFGQHAGLSTDYSLPIFQESSTQQGGRCFKEAYSYLFVREILAAVFTLQMLTPCDEFFLIREWGRYRVTTQGPEEGREGEPFPLQLGESGMTEGADPIRLPSNRDLCVYKGLSNLLIPKDSVSKCHSPWS